MLKSGISTICISHFVDQTTSILSGVTSSTVLPVLSCIVFLVLTLQNKNHTFITNVCFGWEIFTFVKISVLGCGQSVISCASSLAVVCELTHLQSKWIWWNHNVVACAEIIIIYLSSALTGSSSVALIEGRNGICVYPSNSLWILFESNPIHCTLHSKHHSSYS
jgi:hypothetical protein